MPETREYVTAEDILKRCQEIEFMLSPIGDPDLCYDPYARRDLLAEYETLAYRLAEHDEVARICKEFEIWAFQALIGSKN